MYYCIYSKVKIKNTQSFVLNLLKEKRETPILNQDIHFYLNTLKLPCTLNLFYNETTGEKFSSVLQTQVKNPNRQSCPWLVPICIVLDQISRSKSGAYINTLSNVFASNSKVARTAVLLTYTQSDYLYISFPSIIPSLIFIDMEKEVNRKPST